MSTADTLETIQSVGGVIASHYSSIRAEKQGVRQYTKSKMEEKAHILRLLKGDLEILLHRPEETSPLEEASIYEAYNNVLGAIRSMLSIRSMSTDKSLEKLEYDRDLSGLRFSVIKSVLIDEQREQSRTVPAYLLEDE